MTKIRLPVSLKLITCKITETASITKTPPTTMRSSSCLQQIATTPIVPPRESDPVSPMKTFAGKQLNQRKPRPAPISAEQTTVSSPANESTEINHAKQDQPNEAVIKARPHETGHKDGAYDQHATHRRRPLLAAMEFSKTMNFRRSADRLSQF